MCPTSNSSDNNVQCMGNPSLELLFLGSVVASNDNYCGACPALLYTAQGPTCDDYIVNAFCASGNCDGTAAVLITTTNCNLDSVTISWTARSTGSEFPILDCSLVELYQTSICGLGGGWANISGGNHRSPCTLDGQGYGCDLAASWSSSGVFVCSSVPTSAPTGPTQSPTLVLTSVPTYPPLPVFTRSPSNPSNFSFSSTMSGGDLACLHDLTISGPLRSLSIIFFFPGSRSGSWAADMALGIMRHGASPFQIGGYDVFFDGVVPEPSDDDGEGGNDGYLGDSGDSESFGDDGSSGVGSTLVGGNGTRVKWPKSWETVDASTYTTTIDLSANDWTATATYDLCLMNGYQASSPVFYAGSIVLSNKRVPSTSKYCFGVTFGDEVLPTGEGLLVDFILDTRGSSMSHLLTSSSLTSQRS
jgi:hypothetical protein